jgi:7-cyano-7-deazaguanine reductase
LNAERFNSEEAVRERIAVDLSARAGADVAVAFGLPPMADAGSDPSSSGESIDALDIDIDDYGPPNPGHLSADPAHVVEESLTSQLLKSNCPVTGQPDWASVVLSYRGPRLDRAGLLRYLVSFRDHAGFHEQCVERIFHDILTQCGPQALSVEARYTRRGGLDINPWRATADFPAPPAARESRQ